MVSPVWDGQLKSTSKRVDDSTKPILDLIGLILDSGDLLPVQKYDAIREAWWKFQERKCEKCGGHGYVKACRACDGTGVK